MTFLEGGDTCHNNEKTDLFHFWKPRLCRHGKTSCMVVGVGLCCWILTIASDKVISHCMIDTYDDIQICICVLWSESWLMRGTQHWRRIRIENNLNIGIQLPLAPGELCFVSWMISLTTRERFAPRTMEIRIQSLPLLNPTESSI